jgi:phage terminase large subunit-like protein
MDATGQYPDWYPENLRFKKPTKGRIFAETFKVVQDVITEEIEKWFPKGTIKDREKNNQGVYVKYYVKHKSGGTSTFDIFTYEQSPDVCESASFHYVHWDEPPPRAHRAATFRGLTDFMGHERFTLTPLKEPWVFDEIFQNTNVFSVVGDIRHNLYRYNPLSGQYIGLPEQNIRRFESAYTPDEMEARARGKFRFLAGRIWKGWDRDVHTFDRSIWKEGEKGVIIDGQPPQHWKRLFLIDPHDRKPHALLWAALEPEYKRVFVYREAWLGNMNFDAVVSHIIGEEMKYRDKMDYRLIDPNFGPKIQGNTRMTVRETFEREATEQNYPMRFAFGDDHKPLGRKAVSEMLHYDRTQPISIINRPDLMIANDLTQCIYQVEHYVWDDYKFAERDPKEKPKDLASDFPDLLQYLVLFKWDAIDAEVYEGVGSYYNT